MEKILEIKNLYIHFTTQRNHHTAVNGISLSINKGEVFAIVGESGSGKSATALAITKLHNPNHTHILGQVFYNGVDLLTLDDVELNKIRGSHIGMIFQDSLLALNPLMKIGAQIEEVLFYHTDINKAERKIAAIGLLEEVGISSRVYSKLPHELSGGMRQRVMIAIAIACKPGIIIADEPTTALDVTIQATVLDLLRKIKQDTGAAIVLITHDLGVVAEMADRVGVMYSGEIVEIADVHSLFKNPQHSYTRSLLKSMRGF